MIKDAVYNNRLIMASLK